MASSRSSLMEIARPAATWADGEIMQIAAHSVSVGAIGELSTDGSWWKLSRATILKTAQQRAKRIFANWSGKSNHSFHSIRNLLENYMQIFRFFVIKCTKSANTCCGCSKQMKKKKKERSTSPFLDLLHWFVKTKCLVSTSTIESSKYRHYMCKWSADWYAHNTIVWIYTFVAVALFLSGFIAFVPQCKPMGVVICVSLSERWSFECICCPWQNLHQRTFPSPHQ